MRAVHVKKRVTYADPATPPVLGRSNGILNLQCCFNSFVCGFAVRCTHVLTDSRHHRKQHHIKVSNRERPLQPERLSLIRATAPTWPRCVLGDNLLSRYPVCSAQHIAHSACIQSNINLLVSISSVGLNASVWLLIVLLQTDRTVGGLGLGAT